jgi:hypothetical protein
MMLRVGQVWRFASVLEIKGFEDDLSKAKNNAAG